MRRPWTRWMWAMLVVACVRTPEPMPRLAQFDAWQSPAAAFNHGLDGAVLPVGGADVLPGDQAGAGDQLGQLDAPSQADADSSDGASADVATPPPVWPAGALQVASAFSDRKSTRLNSSH